MKYFNLILVLLIPGIVYAAEPTSLTRSAGKMLNDQSIELSSQLASSPVMQAGQTKTADSKSPTIQNRQANHGTSIEFELFDAWVELSGDIDYDGFYHRIKTTFDADVNTSVETVYAKLYLSRDGGPWKQFAETSLFEIFYDSENDTYEIVTELIEGYPPGYYDVLIDLHSLYHQGIVASRIITRDDDGHSMTLEDLSHDDIYSDDEYYYESEYYVGAGSFSWAGLIMLGFLLIIKFRYFSRDKKPALRKL